MVSVMTVTLTDIFVKLLVPHYRGPSHMWNHATDELNKTQLFPGQWNPGEQPLDTTTVNVPVESSVWEWRSFEGHLKGVYFLTVLW